MNLKKTLDELRDIGLSLDEERVPYITDEPKIHNFITLPSNFATEKYNIKGDHGQGYHFDETLSRIKSIGECLERLCLDNPNSEGFIYGKLNENSKFVNPGLFCSYSTKQIGNQEEFRKKLRSENYLWSEVTDLISEDKKFIPAQLIFLSDLFNHEFGIRRESISTGAAFGKIGTNRSFDSGLLESIERDSCIYAYLSKKEIPRIIGFEGEIKKFDEYLSRYNLDTFLFDATSDLEVPTAISVVVDNSGIGSAVDVGSASDFSYKNAIHKSLLEAIQCRRHTRLFGDQKIFGRLPKENEIFSLDHRFAYWHSLDRISDLDFWLKTKNTVSYKSLKSKMKNSKQILDKLKEKNFHVFEADITLPEIKQKGFETKKIMIPELHPLYLDERSKYLYSIHYGEIKEDKDLKPHPLT